MKSEKIIEGSCRHCGRTCRTLPEFGDDFWVHKGNGLHHCGEGRTPTNAEPVEDGLFGLWNESRVWKAGFEVEYGHNDGCMEVCMEQRVEERVEARMDGYAGVFDVIPLGGRRFHIIEDGSITFRDEQRVQAGTNVNGRQYGEVKQAGKQEVCQVHGMYGIGEYMRLPYVKDRRFYIIERGVMMLWDERKVGVILSQERAGY